MTSFLSYDTSNMAKCAHIGSIYYKATTYATRAAIPCASRAPNRTTIVREEMRSFASRRKCVWWGFATPNIAPPGWPEAVGARAGEKRASTYRGARG